MMTPRERLMRSLSDEPTDQVPVWLLFPYHRTAYYVDVRNHPGYRRVFDHSLARGVVMLNRRNLGVRLHPESVICDETKLATPAGTVRRQVMRHRDASIFSEQPRGKKLLASDDDLELFCGMPLEEDEAVLARQMEQQTTHYLRERAEFPLASGGMMLDLGSPINTIYHAADLGTYPIWSLTHSAIIEDWLERRMRQLEFVYRFCLERRLADVYFLVGSELAAPPMVSRETFQRWVVPYESRLIELIHAYGAKVIQHFHGQIREVLPDFVAMSPDGLHTIEAPPVGNCTLTQAFAATREQITLIGNIQYDEFRSTAPTQMKQLVHDVLREVAGRRFILSPTAGPFDPHPPESLLDNYIAFIDAANEIAPRPASRAVPPGMAPASRME